MNITDLKNAVNGIDFDKKKQEQMILEIQEKKRPRRYMGAMRVAAAAAVCVLTVGLLSMPVRAVVNSLLQERMESLPKEEVARITNQIQEQHRGGKGTQGQPLCEVYERSFSDRRADTGGQRGGGKRA